MRKKSLTLVSGLLILAFSSSIEACHAKKWTVTKRIEELSKQIDSGRQANELTTKETADLKKTVLDIQTRMEKMKEKNDGKLGLEDRKKLHKQINELSVKLLRLRLDNVYG